MVLLHCIFNNYNEWLLCLEKKNQHLKISMKNLFWLDCYPQLYRDLEFSQDLLCALETGQTDAKHVDELDLGPGNLLPAK